MKDYNRNGLDLFRLIATVQVFFGHVITHFHMPQWLNIPVYFVRGVPILFVLCGFLAAKSIEKQQAKSWLIGRGFRILPAFWACIILNSLIIALVYAVRPSLKEAAVYGATQLFGLNFYTGDWLRGYGVGTPNGVLWTIPVQIQFFLLVPLFHKWISRRNLKCGLMAVAALTVFSIICYRVQAYIPEIAGKLIGVTVVPYLYFLVLGMVIWYHREHIIPALEKHRWTLVALYILWKLAEIYIPYAGLLDGVMYNTLTTLLISAVIFAFAFRFHWRMRRDLTYGFYLYHMVFMNLAVHYKIAVAQPLWQCGAVILGISALTLLFAWLSQNFVERPAVKCLKKRG